VTSAPAVARRAPQDWHILLAIYFATQVIESYGVSQVFAFMPLYLAQLGLPASEIPRWVGLLGASVFLLGLPLVPLWGVWADKYSRKAVIIRSAIVEVAVFAGVALAQEPWQFAIAMLLVGLQLGNTGVMLAAVRDATPRARLGFAVGMFGAASGIGFALGPIVGGIIVDVLGLPLQAIYWSSAVLTFGIVLLLAFGSREVRPEKIPEGPVLHLAFGAVRGVFTDHATVRLFAIFGVALLATQMARPFIPILVVDLEGTGAGAATGIAVAIGMRRGDAEARAGANPAAMGSAAIDAAVIELEAENPAELR
jgi:MFS transporter, DHA1 family, multidrug resistance protein